MKKVSTRKKASRDQMRREYRFDYRKARPNRFAPLMKGRTVAVVLDPDVASVFRSSESVNSLLRSVISALPQPVKG
jgi:hypothetical protein